jgi:hypothetical protein
MTAIISECGKYRWRLERQLMPLLDVPAAPVLFIGVNPSTADACVDDHTIRKMRSFVSHWGYNSFVVGNVFGYRATDVKRLADVEHPVGADNYAHLQQMIRECAFVVPCWGNQNKVPKPLRVQFKVVRLMLLLCNKPIRIFGLTNGGDPLHPLMLSYDTPLREWSEL